MSDCHPWSVPLLAGSGCFWGRQYDFVNAETALGREVCGTLLSLTCVVRRASVGVEWVPHLLRQGGQGVGAARPHSEVTWAAAACVPTVFRKVSGGGRCFTLMHCHPLFLRRQVRSQPALAMLAVHVLGR